MAYDNGVEQNKQAVRDYIMQVYNSTEDYTKQELKPFTSNLTKQQIMDYYYGNSTPSVDAIPTLEPQYQQPIQAQTPTQKQNTPTTAQKPQKDVEMERAKEIGRQAKLYAESGKLKPTERALSANEQRDMERAMNARKDAEDRRRKTVTETVKTEEQLSGQMPSEITSGTVNKRQTDTATRNVMRNQYALADAIAANTKKESDYDDRGFRKNAQSEQTIEDIGGGASAYFGNEEDREKVEKERIANRIEKLNNLDRPLTKEEKKEAKELVKDWWTDKSLSEKGQFIFSPSEQDLEAERNVKDLRKKSSAYSSYVSGALSPIETLVKPVSKASVNAALKLTGSNERITNEDLNNLDVLGTQVASESHPLAFGAGEMATKIGEYTALSPLLEQIPVVGQVTNGLGTALAGGNTAVGNAIGNVMRGTLADVALDTIPREIQNAQNGMGFADIATDAAGNIAENTLFNTIGEAAPYAWKGAKNLINGLTNKGAVDQAADAARSALNNELNPLEAAAKNADIDNAINQQKQAAQNIEDLSNRLSDDEIRRINELNAEDASRDFTEEITPQDVNDITRLNEVNVYDISDEFAPMSDITRGGGGSGNGIVPRDITRVDDPRGKVSKFATNTMKEGTNLTPEEYARNVDLADFTYENKSERQSMEDAFNMIREEGADNLKARLLSDDAKELTQSEIDALMSITRTNNATARAMEAVGEDASAIRAETTAIYKKLRQQSTSNAQGLQALAKWTRNTPEGMLMHAENIINGNTQVKGSKLQEALKKLKKNKQDIDFSPDFEKRFMEEAEKLQDIGDMDSREAKDIMARLGRMVNDEIPVKLNEKAQAFLMDNMLGNFRTLITRNAGGNLGLAGVEQVATRPLAAGIDRAVSKVTGKRTQAGLSKDGLVEYISGFRKGLSDELHDVKTGLHTARTGENTLENAIRSNRHVFKNKIQDKFDSLVKNGLSVGDRPFYEANYKQTLGDYYRLREQGVMGDVVQNLSDDEFKMYAETAAKLNALASVYQNDSKISDALMGFKKAIGQFSEGTVGFDILSQFSMPFVKTPANVVDRAIDYSPLGIVRNIARTTREGGLKGENFDQNRFVNETARNIIGTTLMGGAAAGAANGVMSGSYSDKANVKQAQKDSGMQEYALNIPGGKQMDIGWLPVVGSNAVAAAAAVDAYKNGDGNIAENLMKGITAGGEALFDQSMFQGLQRLFGSGETYNSESTLPENMVNVVKSGFGQAIPSLLRQGAQVIDKYQRDLGNSNKGLSFGVLDNYDINSLINNIPGLRQNTLAPKVDLSGNLIEENQGRGLGNKILENMILPGKITDINVNPLDEEAIRLEEAGYDKAYRPKASRSTIDKGETPLTNEEWVSYEQRFGQEITNAGNAIINSDLYKNANDETKNSILNTSYDAIKNGINSEYTGSKVTGAAKAYVDAGGGEAGINAVLEYVEAKNNPYGISADTYRKIKESGEDLSQFNGYKEALEQYDIKDSEKLREAWTGGNFENEAQFEVTMNEQGLGDYDSKSAHDAYESGDLDKYKEYREYLKKKELSDSEQRWSDFKSGKIDTTASLNSDIDWSSYGITNKFADEGYAKAKQEIPRLSPQLYAQHYKGIDANNNNGITQDEVIAYLNKIGADETSGNQLWNAFGASNWKKIPVLEGGTWVKSK